MTGEQQIEPVAAAAPVSHCVRTTRLDEREVNLHSARAHARDEIACNLALFAGRAADIHEVRQQRDDVFAGNAGSRLLEIGMGMRIFTPAFGWRLRGLSATTYCFVFPRLRAAQPCSIGLRDIPRDLHHGTACERQLPMPRHRQGNVARYDRVNELR